MDGYLSAWPGKITFAENLTQMAKVSIKLYGDIFDWSSNSAQAMVARIAEAARTADEIELHVHCYGGSVIEGNMIYNAIAGSDIPIDAYIDGVAASMAPIVLMAARKIYMSENAFMMLHAPAGGYCGRGTATEHIKAAKALTAMEKQFIKALTTRTGKTEEQVKEWMSGDNWFSAEQALSEGLIDGIVDPIAGNVKQLTSVELQSSNVESIYSLYTASLSQIQNQNQTTNQMDKATLIAQLGLTGVTAASTDEQVQAAITAKFAAEQLARQNAEKKLTEHQAAEITAVLDTVKDKITVDQRAQLQAIGEKVGIAALKTAIEPYRTAKPFSAIIGGDGGSRSQSTLSASWNFAEWQKNDPAGLEKLAKEDPETFNALYGAAFSKK